MKRFIMICALATAGAWLNAQAAPLAGCYEVTPPGHWSELLIGGQPGHHGNEITAGDGATYEFFGATIAEVRSDTTGEWDWITRYTGGTLVLTNTADAGWYFGCEQASEFVLPFPEVIVKTRSTRYASTNQGYLEFELSGQSAWVSILATYAGLPTYTAQGSNVLASAALGSARICVGKEITVDVRPGSRVNPFNMRSRGVLPVAILGGPDFDVSQVDPATIRLQCVPATRWSMAQVNRDRIKDLSLKFETEAIASTLGTVSKRQVVKLTLTAALKDGTPLAGFDEVQIVGNPTPKPPKPAKPAKPEKPKNNGKGQGRN